VATDMEQVTGTATMVATYHQRAGHDRHHYAHRHYHRQ
jgi:hypothetical protein